MKHKSNSFSGTELTKTIGSLASSSTDQDLPAYQPRSILPLSGASYFDDNGKVRLSGTQHADFVMRRFAESFSTFHPDIEFSLELFGTQTATPFLIHDRSLAVVMGREMSDVEAVPYRKGVSAEPALIRIAHAALSSKNGLATSLAVYVHHSNPLEHLTMTDLSRIFTIGNPKGDVSRWGQIGLNDSWAERLIHPIGTPESSGFGSYMQRHHFSGRALTPFYEQCVGGKAVLARLADNPAGIAVAAIGGQDKNLRQIPLAWNESDTFSVGRKDEISNCNYPLGRFLNLYLRHESNRPLDPLAGEFVRFILSREGQAIVKNQPEGYLPLKASLAARERSTLEEWLSAGQKQIQPRRIDYV
ncbi:MULTISPECIES: PstS family phosphate ABC transporter substrate-binding protein [Paraliobacillus]|uniref:PstS family phosphate ABC transporter substrate-binding protein n=1 Tax=Paraliobacillus TaxID=200903 RepID=UPI000DD2DF5E|nr:MULTISPECIES: phosphate-binding protein [Paraliobacillus]